jgi:hypothetical protein
MPKDYIGFQGGKRRRRRITALYDARLIRIQSGRRDRIDCRGARRNRVARIERQYFATDDGRNERRRGAPFGSDHAQRPEKPESRDGCVSKMLSLQLQKSPTPDFEEKCGNSPDISKSISQFGIYKFESSEVSQAVTQLQIVGW